LKVSAPNETFVATLTYDTLDLYGKMEIAFPILVSAE
jgi:hypothetical protein